MDVEAELLAEGDVEGVGGKVSETLDEARLQNWRASDSALESWSEHWEETQPTRSRGKFPLFATDLVEVISYRICRRTTYFAQKQDTSVMVEQFTCETASARQLLTVHSLNQRGEGGQQVTHRRQNTCSNLGMTLS